MRMSKSEVAAIMEAAPRTSVPLNKLVRCETYQARPAGSTTAQSIEELAASIRKHHVLQNLVVIQGDGGQWEVCAGARRLEALQLLASRGEIAVNYPVPVMVVPPDKALAASLSENVQRVAMHPADEFEAFARLIAAGQSIEDVAAAFGVTPLVVRRRMKLAAVAPQLLTLYRQGEIGLDCLMALASVDDHERQLQVWETAPRWNLRPETLRRLLAADEVESDRDPLAVFVGLDAYTAAGGAVRRDLFSEDGNKAYLADAGLLERLAHTLLEPVAQKLRTEGWRWVDIQARHSTSDHAQFGRLRAERREATEEERHTMVRLRQQLDDVQQRMDAMEDAQQDNDDDEAYGALVEEAERLQEQLDTCNEVLQHWPASAMARAGCVVFVNPQASVEVRFGLVRPQDREAAAQGGASSDVGGGSGSSGGTVTAAKPRPVHSERLVRCLTAQRVAAMQAELMERPDMAQALLVAQWAPRLLHGSVDAGGAHRRPTTTVAESVHAELPGDGVTAENSSAWRAVESQRERWAAEVPSSWEEAFGWALDQETSTVRQLLALLVALTIQGVQGDERPAPAARVLAGALALDMRMWWSVGDESYLRHVPKARIMDVVAAVKGSQVANSLAVLKKNEAVASAERLLAGSGWLPEVLRNPGASDRATAAAPAEQA